MSAEDGGGIDPTALFQQLFGGGAFDHIFGQVDLMNLFGDPDANSEGLKLVFFSEFFSLIF